MEAAQGVQAGQDASRTGLLYVDVPEARHTHAQLRFAASRPAESAEIHSA